MASRPTSPVAPPTGLFPLLAMAVLVEAAGVGALFPLLARIQVVHHLPTASLGIMSGAAFIAALVAQVGLGRLLDGPQARVVLLAGLALGAAAQVWFGFAGSLWQLATARALGGVSFGVVMPAALRAGSLGVGAEQRGTRLGRLASMQMLGIVAGPLLGATLYSLGGLRAPFVTIGALDAVLLVALLALPAAPVADADPSPSPLVDARGAGRPRLRSRPVVAVLLLAAALQLPYGLYDALWSRLLTDRGAGTLLIGLSLTCFGIPYAVLAPYGGRLAGRRSPLLWSGGALVVASGFMAAYGVVTGPVVIVVLGCFEACAQAVAVPGGYAATASVFPDRWSATGQAWSAAAGTLAAGSSALLSAPLYQAAGPGVVFGAGAALSVALVLAALRFGRPGAVGGGPAAHEEPVSVAGTVAGAAGPRSAGP